MTDALLQKFVAEANARFEALSPEQQEAHRQEQRDSYVRAELAWPEPEYHWENGVKVYHSYTDYCNG